LNLQFLEQHFIKSYEGISLTFVAVFGDVGKKI